MTNYNLLLYMEHCFLSFHSNKIKTTFIKVNELNRNRLQKEITGCYNYSDIAILHDT